MEHPTVTYINTNNDRVSRVVQLLGDIAQNHGDGELQDSFPGSTLGHIRGSEQAFKTQIKTTPYIFFYPIV